LGEYNGPLTLAAVIHENGSVDDPDQEDRKLYDSRATYIGDPFMSEMTRSDLTGQFRLHLTPTAHTTDKPGQRPQCDIVALRAVVRLGRRGQ